MTDDWADEALEDDRPGAAERKAARDERRRRAVPADPQDRRRWPVVGVVAIALALAGLSGGIKAGGAGTMPIGSNVVASSILPVVSPSSASSSAWYCPGPLPLSPKGGSSLEIANISTATVVAQLTIAVVAPSPNPAQAEPLRLSPAGTATTTALTIPPMATSTYALPGAAVGSLAAVSVLAKGGGVAVAETAPDQGVPTTSSCQDMAGGNWLLASGSTAHTADMLVSLFDPTSLPAVVNVSCAVPAPPGTLPQAISPPTVQGLTLAPGQMEVVDLGRVLQLRPNLGVAVTSTSGRVVVGEWTQTAVGRTYYGRLQQGVSAGLAAWSFPLAASPPGTTPVYWLFNPATEPTKVQVAISVGTKNLSTEQVSVPPSALEVVAPSAATGRQSPPAGFAVISTVSGPPVVAARGYIVKGATTVKKGRRPKHSKAPAPTPAVYAPWTMLGAGLPASSWLVFVPPGIKASATAATGGATKGHHRRPAAGNPFKEAIYVANSDAVAAAIVVYYLAGAVGGATSHPRPPTHVIVPPGATVRVPLLPVATAGAVRVTSPQPVTVELDLYSPKLPSGDAAAGIPIP